VTNAAFPALDAQSNPIVLSGRSMATIFGTNLATAPESSVSPWSTSLAGVEVHLANDACFDSSCELAVRLIYVSPTQINFVMPDGGLSAQAYRIVLVINGQRFDNHAYLTGGPGRIMLDSLHGDSDVAFEVGSECRYSYSLTDPGACGLGWQDGQHRAPLPAITDAISGALITSSNPIYQGRVITIWFTGIRGELTLNPQNGLLEQRDPPTVNFGVAQQSAELSGISDFTASPVSGVLQAKPLWVGEAPTIVGMNQMNVIFPPCSSPPATVEKRYDAFISYNEDRLRLYVPFVVRPGDNDCFAGKAATSIGISIYPNPAAAYQAFNMTAVLTAHDATGTVTFYVGQYKMATQYVDHGQASFTGTGNIPPGDYPVRAVYSGDATYYGSEGVSSFSISKIKTAITLTANPSSIAYGQIVHFATTVTPATDGGGSITLLDNGIAIAPNAILAVGTHTITASYSGDADYLASTSAPVTVVVNKAQIKTTITLTANPSSIAYGQIVHFTTTVTPATDGGGSITLSDNGIAIAPSAILAVGTHTITASYSGDADYLASISAPVTVVVNKAQIKTTITLTANPSSISYGQTVNFVTTVTPATDGGGSITLSDNGVTIAPSAILALGNHWIMASYSGDANYLPSTAGPVLVVVTPAPPTGLTLQSDTSTTRMTAMGLSDTILVTWVKPDEADVMNGGHIEINYMEHDHYSDGSVSVTNGSPTVTGSGTAWFPKMAGPGDGITLNGVLYEILRVDSPTQLTLTSPYIGPTNAAIPYAIDYGYTWIPLQSVQPSVTQVDISPVKDGVQYWVEIRSVNALGYPSPWITAGPITAEGVNTPLPLRP
jgi:hypothetical protein